MKLAYKNWYLCLFFGISFLGIYSCSNSNSITNTKQIHSSWDGGFLLKYKTYTFGNILSQYANDPFFVNLPLKKQLEKEFSFQLPSTGLSYNPILPDLMIYNYFIGDSLNQPVLPYIPENESTREFVIKDTLKTDELFLITDFVQREGLFLVWRSAVKISYKNHVITPEELRLVIEKIASSYPG